MVVHLKSQRKSSYNQIARDVFVTSEKIIGFFEQLIGPEFIKLFNKSYNFFSFYKNISCDLIVGLFSLCF